MSDRIAAVVWNATRSGGSVVPLLPKPEPTGGGVKEVWKFPKGVAVGVGVGDGAAVGGTVGWLPGGGLLRSRRATANW